MKGLTRGMGGYSSYKMESYVLNWKRTGSEPLACQDTLGSLHSGLGPVNFLGNPDWVSLNLEHLRRYLYQKGGF